MFMSSRSLSTLWEDDDVVSHVDEGDNAVAAEPAAGAAPVNFRNLSASRLRIEVDEFDPSLSPVPAAALVLPGG
jgi:hypothetical protein